MTLITSRKMPTDYNTSTYGNETRDYQSLSAWVAAKLEGKDLVAAEKGEVLVCYDDDAPYNDRIDDSTVSCTTSADYFPVVMAAPGHEGTKTSGVRFENAGTATERVLRLNISFMSWFDLAAKNVLTGEGLSGYVIDCHGDNSCVSGCLVYDSSASTNSAGIVFQADGCVCINCVVINQTGGSTRRIGFFANTPGGSVTTHFYNNSAIDCGTGYEAFAAIIGRTIVMNVKNCISSGNTNNFVTSGDGTTTINQTTNATTGVTFAADGYSLASTDTSAIDEGTDLSADATFAFNDDFFGRYRPGKDSTGWDIGAHEYDGYLLKISGTLKEKESGAGSPEHYILIDESDGSVIEAGAAAADGSFDIAMTDETTTHTLIMPDKDGEYTAVAASLLTAVQVTSQAEV